MKRMMEQIVRAMALMMSVWYGLAVQAETIAVSGGEVSYTGASDVKTLANGDVVLVFTDTATPGSFTLPKYARARYLVVGGGGAGGSMGIDVGRSAAGGGGAGGMVDRERVLDPGDYTVTVGAGGPGVQTVVQSWVGTMGGDSSLGRLVPIPEDQIGADGETTREIRLITVKGGGGGATVKLNGRGTDGGSGGGGSWYGTVLTAGLGVDAYGWAGGTPTDENFGGGGGGAALTEELGHGGADGTPGAGRTSDILPAADGTAVLYAQGGRGGRRGDETYRPAKGAGFGFGGDGAVSLGDGKLRDMNFGGAGGDGVVIVRISSLFEYESVDYPTYTQSFLWENGKTFRPFSATGSDQPWTVKGTTEVACSSKGSGETFEMVGIGLYSFTLELKDGYVWRDGSMLPHECKWRVMDPDTVGCATLDATKRVSWADREKARITIDIHTTPESRNVTPRVLVLGSLCNAHGFDQKKLQAMLNALTQKADVDYFFYAKEKGTEPQVSGTLKKGESFTDDMAAKAEEEMSGGQHGTLNAFYAKLDEVKTAGPAYDYILFSFDRSQVATYYPSNPDTAREARVVDYLTWFYENDRVIWFVDQAPKSNEAIGVSQFPWAPSPMTIIRLNDRDSWKTLGYYQYTYGGDKSSPYGFKAYRALMGMFCPSKYATITKDTYDSMTTVENEQAIAKLTQNGVTSQSGEAIQNQTAYDDAAAITKLIERLVMSKVMTVKATDQVAVSLGLSVDNVAARWTTDRTKPVAEWTPLDETQLSLQDGKVDINLDGVTEEAWIKLEIDVEDQGFFRSSIGAEYNEKTGMWEKDPNDGAVRVSMQPRGEPEIVCLAETKTSVQWPFTAHRIVGEVVHGEGEIVFAGHVQKSVSVATGMSPEVVFRGKAGWVLDYLEVDGEVRDFTAETYDWTFENIAEDHTIKVGFKQVLTVPQDMAVEDVMVIYDGQPHLPELVGEPTFETGYELPWRLAYYTVTTDADGQEIYRPATGRVNVGDESVVVRIEVRQQGYEDWVVFSTWTGSGKVTVNPRSLIVAFDDYVQTGNTPKTTDFTYQIVGLGLVAGDTLDTNAGVCTAYPLEKGMRLEEATITAKGTMHVTTPDFGGCNYTISVINGWYYWPKLDVVATAPSITKVYDGINARVMVETLYPNEEMRQPQYGDKVKGESSEQPLTTGDETMKIDGDTYKEVSQKTTQYTTTDVTSELEILYRLDGGTYGTTSPQFVDVGIYTVYYKVNYKEKKSVTTETTTVLSGRKKKKSGKWGNEAEIPSTSTSSTETSEETYDYTPARGTAKITITPRKVTVTTASGEKIYDGTPLSAPTYTLTPATATGDAGFIAGEGFAPVSGAPSLTNPGVLANDLRLAFNAQTKARNYEVTYVDGKLRVAYNQLKATATAQDSVYNGEANTSFALGAVTDAQGRVLAAGEYQVLYKTTPWDDYALTAPPQNVNAGTYEVYYKIVSTVGDGTGYIPYEGFATYTISPAPLTVKTGSATKVYDGQPLTCHDYTVEGLAARDEIREVKITSSITKPGQVANKIDQISFVDPHADDNYTLTQTYGTLTVTGRLNTLSVDGDGELRFTVNPSDTAQTVAVFVDGVKVCDVTVPADGTLAQVVHISDLTGHDGATHEVGFFVAAGEPGDVVTGVDWSPSATPEQLLAAVETDPPTTGAEKQAEIQIANEVESGWMSVTSKDADGNTVWGLESPIGKENDASGKNESSFTLTTAGSGEIQVREIRIPVKAVDVDGNTVEDWEKYNSDHGALTITVDGVEYKIPPKQDDNVSYNISVENGVITITDLVIKVATANETDQVDAQHDITFTYTRDNSGTQEAYTSAYVSGIVWKSYGETADGGTSWLKGEPLIIDHEDPGEGFVYLAFEPGLKASDNLASLKAWVKRSSDNGKIKVKYGATREALAACEPVVATLSDENDVASHEVKLTKVWIKVKVADLVQPVGFWRIYIENSDSASAPSGKAAKLADAEPLADAEETTAEPVGAESANTFGILKIESTAKETMIAVPWTWYSKEEAKAADIPVKKLVKTTNLSEGDYLYCWLPAEGVYRTWIVNEDREWESSKTVLVDALGNTSETQADNDAQDADYEHATRVARGGGLWLVRQDPTKPFWVYGQSVQTAVTTTINPPTGAQKVCSNMIGNPYARPVRINDLVFAGTISTSDRIKVPDGTNTPKTLIYVKGKGWRWTKTVLGDDGRVVSVYDYDVAVPAGQAFWYDRRGTTTLTVKW